MRARLSERRGGIPGCSSFVVPPPVRRRPGARREPARGRRAPRPGAAGARRPRAPACRPWPSRSWPSGSSAGEASGRRLPPARSDPARGGPAARRRHRPARRHHDHAAGPHPPVARLRHPARGGGPGRRPRAAAAERARAGRHPRRAARRPRGRGVAGAALAGVGAPRAAHPHLPRRAARPADACRRAGPRPRGPRPASGVRHDRPEWVAAAHVLREYDEVTALSAPGAFDPAWILGAAADHLEADPEALDRLRAGLRLVVVDDAQELTPAALRLLQVVVGRRRGRPRAARRPRRRHPDLPRRRPAAVRHRLARRRPPGCCRPRTGAAARCSPPPPGWRPTSVSWAVPPTAR